MRQARAYSRKQIIPGRRIKYRGRGAVVLHLLRGPSSVARARFPDGREATVSRVKDVILRAGRRMEEREMCMYDPHEQDGGVYFGSGPRRARKEHICGECRRAIRKGERYFRAAGVQDGYAWDAKQCAQCAAAAGWLVKECGGFLFGGVQQDLEEHLDEVTGGAWVALARLVIGMRHKWQPVWRKAAA